MEEKKMNIKEKLALIQSELKAPKNQRNTFGNYNFRSAEDILEAVKPICLKYRTVLHLSDDLVVKGTHSPIVYQQDVFDSKAKKMVTNNFITGDQRFYIEATAILEDLDSDDFREATAYAREEENKKGMDGSQITGTASSYARKYALNGLFDIDDTKDADTDEHANQTKEDKKEVKITPKQLDEINKLFTDKQIPKLCERYEVETLEELTVKQASEIIKKMKEAQAHS